MFETFKDMKVHVRATEIVNLFARYEQWCERPVETPACGIVTTHAVGFGKITTVTLGDSMGDAERRQIDLLEEKAGKAVGDCVIAYHDICEWPHPRMKGSSAFVQFGIFEEAGT
ncbi:hypothetical protein [Streptomyces vinaceus]|uniref:hypothetical protein n=1 Tax=Streptomyces vinaceus TaxID=1960 RepID=UPI003692D190